MSGYLNDGRPDKDPRINFSRDGFDNVSFTNISGQDKQWAFGIIDDGLAGPGRPNGSFVICRITVQNESGNVGGGKCKPVLVLSPDGEIFTAEARRLLKHGGDLRDLHHSSSLVDRCGSPAASYSNRLTDL